MRTIVVPQLKRGSEGDLGFVVLNRPHSVVRGLDRLDIPEKYVLIAETDHILLKPLPNLVGANEALAYPFHYMAPARTPKTAAIVARYAGAHAAAVQQIGPSPAIVHVGALRRVARDWLETSFALKRDPEADAEFG